MEEIEREERFTKWFLRMYGNNLKDCYVGEQRYKVSDLIKDAFEAGLEEQEESKD